MESSRKPFFDKKNAAKNWTFRWRLQCLARWEQRSAQIIQQNSPTQSMHCIVEAHESTRKRLESTLPRNHEDHIAEKGFNSTSHYHLVHNFIPMPQAMNIPDAKAAVDKERKKLQKLPAWQLDKVKSKKGSSKKHKKRKESPLCCTDGHLSLKKCGVRT